MIRIFSRVWKFLWHYSFFRFGTFHVPAGALNYTVAFLLFWYAEVDKYTATTVGHFIHVAIGFFYDRDVTFRAKEKKGSSSTCHLLVQRNVIICLDLANYLHLG